MNKDHDPMWDDIDPVHPMYYDRDGQPISMRQWTKLRAFKRVAETTVGPLWVSTVWLGIDHGFHFLHLYEGEGAYRPVIFETMVFYKGDGGDHPEIRAQDQEMWRYSTEAEALAGHAMVVSEMRRLLQNVEMADEVIREAVERGKRSEPSG